MKTEKNKIQAEVMPLTMSDNYVTHYRIWGKSEGEEVIIFIHGE